MKPERLTTVGIYLPLRSPDPGLCLGAFPTLFSSSGMHSTFLWMLPSWLSISEPLPLVLSVVRGCFFWGIFPSILVPSCHPHSAVLRSCCIWEAVLRALLLRVPFPPLTDFQHLVLLTQDPVLSDPEHFALIELIQAHGIVSTGETAVLWQ